MWSGRCGAHARRSEQRGEAAQYEPGSGGVRSAHVHVLTGLLVARINREQVRRHRRAIVWLAISTEELALAAPRSATSNETGSNQGGSRGGEPGWRHIRSRIPGSRQLAGRGSSTRGTHLKAANHACRPVPGLLVTGELERTRAGWREDHCRRVADFVVHVEDIPRSVIGELGRIVVGLDVVHVGDGNIGDQVVVFTASVADRQLNCLAYSQAHGFRSNCRISCCEGYLLLLLSSNGHRQQERR